MDLAIAVALLLASRQVESPVRERLNETLWLGELGLDGSVRPVFFFIVDMSEFSADKLANRGSAQAQAILTNAQDFIVNLWNNLRK